jgi:hypothetical protein
MVRALAALTAGAEKQEVLTALVPPAALAELERLRADGVSVGLGDTNDAAYDDASNLGQVVVRLHEGGISFNREVGALSGVIARLASALSLLPMSMARRWGRRMARRQRERGEVARTRILYGQPDVQGGAWHQQNGRATALVTIVDAHDLATSDRFAAPSGKYPRASGRLDRALLDYRFDSRSGWLDGHTLMDALAESAVRFRGWGVDRSRAFATAEMNQLTEFLTAPVHPGFKDIVANCVDSLGIRSRKAEVHREILRHVGAVDPDEPLLLSIGCGTALPLLEVLDELRSNGHSGRLILVDQDPIALASAHQLADQFGLADAIEIHCQPLILGGGLASRVLDLATVLQGRRVDVCEDSGLREYFPDKLYVELASKAWQATKPGGLITTGNMNSNRPQPEFLHGLMGWPIPVRMRTMRQVHRLHLKAGIPRELVRLRLTQDAVYTLCFITKPTGPV